jgi:mannose/fructose/N-acetylgalactosamine-specific phosphotransferase system component IIC
MSERTFEVVLGLIGAGNVAVGLLALLAPDTFFDQIGKYGVENSHYVGDAGAFIAAYGFAVLVAIRHPSWRVPVLALGAIWYGLHAINHAFDTGQASSEARGWADTISIALIGVLLAYLANVARRLPGPAGEAPR